MDIRNIKNIGIKIGQILSYICLAFLFFMALFLAFYIITNQIARYRNEKPLISLYTIVSPSMEPNIKVYDIIIDTRVRNHDELHVGDVITFYSDVIDTGGYTVTHRINEITELDGKTIYLTKGDNNQSIDDGYITIDNIVGKVQYIIPALGRVQFFISSRLGWFIIILIPALGIIIMDLMRLINVFRIKRQIEQIPQIKEINEVRETEENKKVRALLEKARRFNKSRSKDE